MSLLDIICYDKYIITQLNYLTFVVLEPWIQDQDARSFTEVTVSRSKPSRLVSCERNSLEKSGTSTVVLASAVLVL